MSLRVLSDGMNRSMLQMSHIEDFDDESEDEQQIAQKANLKHIYLDDNLEKQSKVFGNSVFVVQEILDNILDLGAKQLYNNYLESKIDDHSTRRTFNLLEQGIFPNYFLHDQLDTVCKNDGLIEDLEPPCHTKEHWKSYSAQIEIRKRFQFSENQSEISKTGKKKSVGRLSTTKISFKYKNNTQYSQQDEKSERMKKTSDKLFEYTLVDNRVEREFDLVEEQFRTAKERDVKIKAEQEQQRIQREKELKEQQQKLRQQNSDLKKTVFTYDYNGNVIPQQPLKQDNPYQVLTKLQSICPKQPLSIQRTSVVTGMHEDISTQQQSNNQRPSQLGGTGQGSKHFHDQSLKALADYQQPNIFDAFNMNHGVTFLQDKAVKQGPLYRSGIDATNQDNLLNQNSSVRMTRYEYNDITRSGNLSRSEEQNFLKKKSAFFQSSLVPEEDNDFTQDNQDILKALDQKSMLLAKKKRQKVNNGHISANLKDDTLLKNFTQDIVDDIDRDNREKAMQKSINKTMSQPSFSIIKDKYNMNNSIETSIMDSFNMQLLTQGGGTNKKANQSLILPKIAAIKPQDTDFKQSLGILSKNPRSRIGKIAEWYHSTNAQNSRSFISNKIHTEHNQSKLSLHNQSQQNQDSILGSQTPLNKSQMQNITAPIN